MDPEVAANSPLYLNRGKAYIAVRQPDKAIKDFTKTIEIDPGSDDAYNNKP